MIIIVCVDNNGGMMFNKRRQSQDKKLRERILDLTKDGRLLMNNYSYKLFGNSPQIKVDDNFLENCTKNDFCFVENSDVLPYKEKIQKIIIYKWNRSYPSDLKFPISFDKEWKLVSTENFAGSSHDKITEEVYEKLNSK